MEGLVAVRVDPSAYQRPKLSNKIQHRYHGPSFRVRVLIVDRPYEDEGYGGENPDAAG